jgi:hypothetical protein
MTSIRTTPIRTLLTIVGILATMLMVLLTAPDSAQGKPIQGNDSLAIECRKLRSDAEALLEEYRRHGTTDERLAEIREELRDKKRSWDAVGCQEFGDIVRHTGKPTGGLPGPGSAPPHAGNAGAAHAPTQSPSPRPPLAHGGTANPPLAHGTAPAAQR